MTGDAEEEFGDSQLAAGLIADDADVETSLRPKTLTDFIGQPRVREQLQ
ncbi:MAG: Holliday junction branch migration DNA helicase RuvB, partial [Rhodococcus sp. (in: high G+C Gram-positive bacteria)]